MTSIGFIGTENSHTDHFIRFLNTEERHPGFHAAALAGGPSERNHTLASDGDLAIVESPEDLGGQVDAAIISTRDGARHREQAEPLLRAGMPVLVDKPLATGIADAEAIIAAAETSGAPLVSCSALRFVPQIAEVSEGGTETLRQLTVIGPADPDSPYSGLFFYGIHHVEAALEILGNPVVEPGSVHAHVTRDGDTTVAHIRIAGVEVTFTFVVPDGKQRVPFYAVATRTTSVTGRELTLDPDYNAPALGRFVEAVRTGRSPVPAAELLSPIVIMSAIVDALHNRKDLP
ncbi:Gfo/Idh/MocA family oxidoreductase [Ruania alba]|uniref:Predicted dehydrogenase n=1 Tax=Ruania alba TaxID=648782 RepID=A0A1H5MQY3_9MICO|nr:Gfo/Idh/MocA family oxidoreductase [Ruania alba]SEE91696.1 Predicted dehydrogenase [Ruania alba]